MLLALYLTAAIAFAATQTDARFMSGAGGALPPGGGNALQTELNSMPGGQVAAFGSNTLASVGYNGPFTTAPWWAGPVPNVMATWSSGDFDPIAKLFWVWGGGHNDYHGDETYKFNTATALWALGSLPSDGTSYSDSNTPAGVMPDGVPAAYHTYDGTVYWPGHGLFAMGGGFWSLSGTTGNLWIVNTSTLSPTQTAGSSGTNSFARSSTIGPFGNNSVVAAYDPNSTHIWLHWGIQGAGGVYEWDGTTLTHHGTGFGGQTDIGGTIDGTNKKFWIFGAGVAGFLSVDPSNGSTEGNWNGVTTTGDQTCQNSVYPGVHWDPTTGDIICYPGPTSEGAGTLGYLALWRFNVSTLVWTKVIFTFTGSGTNLNAAPLGANGTFSRFYFGRSPYNVALLINEINQSFYVFKPSF